MLDLMRLGYASQQRKRAKAPAARAPAQASAPAPADPPAAPRIPDDTPGWMKRGFLTGRWR